MRGYRFHNNRGISLLEVMISMLILAFGVLGLTPLFVVAVEGNIISRDNSTVAALLKEKVEYFEGLDSLPTMPFSEHETGLNDLYSRSIFLSDNSSDTLIPGGVCQLNVRISWTTHDGMQRTTSYSTYILK